MLLTITTTCKPATDLGYLVRKHPGRCQRTDLSFGTVHIFFPEATESRCTPALLLDIDAIEMVRGRRRPEGGLPLEQYINDRPYVASSFLSVAIAKVLSSALKGECKDRPELVETVMPWHVRIAVVPSRSRPSSNTTICSMPTTCSGNATSRPACARRSRSGRRTRALRWR
jgi:hypothetical protein